MQVILIQPLGSNPNGNHDQIYVEPTSYDYDALISEAGDLTKKYFAMKKVIAKYLPIPSIHVNETVPKGDYGAVNMTHVVDIFSLKKTPLLKKPNGMDISEFPMTFEQLDQEHGFVLYEHVIHNMYRNPALLEVTGNSAIAACHY